MWRSKKNIERLIQKKFNGSINPEEDAILDKIIAGDEKVRTHYYRLLNLEKELQNAKPTEETVDISGRVIQKINSPKDREKTTPTLQFFGVAFFYPMPMRFAAIFIVGILIGSAITWTIIPNRQIIDNANLSGSMMAKSGQTISFIQSNVNVKVAPYAIGTTYYLNFIIDTRDEITIETVFDGGMYAPIKSDYLISGGRKSMDSSNGLISFTALGTTSFQMIFEKTVDENIPVTIKVLQNQTLLTSEKLYMD